MTASNHGRAFSRSSVRLCSRAMWSSLPAPGSCQESKSTSQRTSTGTTNAVIAQEIASAAAIVSDSALEKAPVTPVRKDKGTNTISVARLEPVSGARNSRAAGMTAASPRGVPSAPVAPARRAICSTITMTSSISRPTAAAMPPSVMMLKLMPSTLSTSTVAASVAGTTIAAISVTRQLRRNASNTKAASTRPISTASRTLATASVTSAL
ncbi:hypothetical protein D9M73_161980 [compost metagenome]